MSAQRFSAPEIIAWAQADDVMDDAMMLRLAPSEAVLLASAIRYGAA